MNQNKFRVLFIYPNFPLSNMLLPAGVSILSAVLKENGIETKLFDTTLYADGKETFDGNIVLVVIVFMVIRLAGKGF